MLWLFIPDASSVAFAYQAELAEDTPDCGTTFTG